MHPHLVRTAIRTLAGRQVTDVEDLYGLICGEVHPDLMPRAIRRGLPDLLRVLGYTERWIVPVDGGCAMFRWVRDPWPIDAEVLRGRDVETYTSYDWGTARPDRFG